MPWLPGGDKSEEQLSPLHMALSSLGTTELQLTHCLGILAINHNRNVKIITLLRINRDLGLF